jgi:cytoskeletal protein CcmA (bactofilin family)
MWNKRKEEEAPAKTTPTAPASGSAAKESHPTMSTPHTPSAGTSADRGGSATIGKSVMIKGQIFSREDLTIDGEVEGSVECQEHRLTVGPHGRVHAGVKARELIVLGAIHGNVEVTDKIDIRKDAKLVGDIRTARISIEDGAYFKGSIDIARPEVSKPPATTTPVKAASASAPAASAPAASAPPASAQSVAVPAGNAAEPKR